MKFDSILNTSVNVILLAIFYTVLGGIISYVFYWLFDDHDDEWEAKSTTFKVYDVFAEVSILGLIAFWITVNVKDAPPIFKVSKAVDEFTDSYMSGIFFTFSIFIFLGDLSTKIKYLYDELIGSKLNHILPKKGSILDGTLRLT
jgi:hypothetical protein